MRGASNEFRSHPNWRAEEATIGLSGPRPAQMGVGFRRPTWMWETQIMQVAEVEANLAQQLENVREMERKDELPTPEELRAELNDN
jgi:hypothetical protein